MKYIWHLHEIIATLQHMEAQGPQATLISNICQSVFECESSSLTLGTVVWQKGLSRYYLSFYFTIVTRETNKYSISTPGNP